MTRILLLLSLFFLLSLVWAPPVAVAAPGLRLLDAVRYALRHQPAVLLQREQVRSSRSTLRSTAAAFDWNLANWLGVGQDFYPDQNSVFTSLSGIPRESSLVNPSLGVKLSKLFRWGILLETTASINKTVYDLPFKVPGYDNYNSGSLRFNIKVPVLPFPWRQPIRALETSASEGYQAARLVLKHTLATAVRDTAYAYWNYLAAYRSYQVYRQSADRSALIVTNTAALAAAGELPRVAIKNAQANLADKTRALLGARQDLVEAKATLAQAMGLPVQDRQLLRPPRDDFPTANTNTLQHLKQNRPRYRKLARRRRMDLQAQARAIRGARSLVDAYRLELGPKINIDLSLGYDSYNTGNGTERFFDGINYHQHALDWSAGLRIDFPFGNNAAQANLDKSLADLNSSRIRKRQLQDNIDSMVAVSLQGVDNALAELEKSEQAVRIYTEAVNNERLKFRRGESTLLNLIDIEERLDRVLLTRIAVRRRLAMSLIRLRYETGTLVSFQKEQGTITARALTTIPDKGQ